MVAKPTTLISVRKASDRPCLLAACLVLVGLASIVSLPDAGVSGSIGPRARAVDPATARALGSISDLLYSGHTAAADSVAERLLSEARSRHGPQSLGTLAVLDTMVGLFHATSRIHGSHHALARRYSDQFVSLGEQLVGRDAISLAIGFNRHSILCSANGDFATARTYGELAVALAERDPGGDPSQLAGYLDVLARARGEEDQESARAIAARALEIRRTTLGMNAPGVAESMRNWGAWLRTHGDFVSARQHLEDALAIIDRRLPADDPGRCVFYNSLGALFGETGDYRAAAEHFARCVSLSERAHGVYDYDVARFMNNLGLVYTEMRRFREAEVCFDSALAIRDSIRNWGGVAETQQSLGALRAREGAYATAIPLFTKALDYRKRDTGIYNSGVAETLEELAAAYTHIGEYAQAESCYAQDLRIRGRITPPGHPAYAAALGGYAYLRLTVGDTAAALQCAVEAESLSRSHFIITARTLSERQALAYAAHRPSTMNVALSVASPSLPARGVERIWDAAIRSRAVVLDEMASRHRVVSASGDSAVQRLNDSLGIVRRRLFGLLTRERGDDAAGRDAVLDEARRGIDHLERRLGERSARIRIDLVRSRAGYAEVMAAVPERGALVAYVRHKALVTSSARRLGAADSTAVYAAFVLRAGDSAPTFIRLGSAARVDSLVERWRAEASQPRHDPTAAGASEERCFRAGMELRARVWDPVAAKLGDARDIFVVPDGSLQFVNLGALPASRSSFLIEAPALIHVLSCERDLVPLQRERQGEGLLALGGADFDHASAQDSNLPVARLMASAWRDDRDRAQYRDVRGGCDSPAALRFSPLSGTAREVSDIVGEWRAAHRISNPGSADALTIALADSMASEAAFKRKAPGRRVIHLASHGFFLDVACDPTRPPEWEAQNPLLLTGLALAGANDRSERRSDLEDGILTAEEIAGLDLSGVDWAVLSACNTGLGVIRAGEGVFGLRRAFAIAGARTTIMSLWRVEDAAVRRWMRRLYQARFVQGLTTAAAVRQASVAILRERRRLGESTDPSGWGAFIAAGGD